MNTTYSVPTDQKNKITVESQLVYAMWTQGRAYAGFEAAFEVKTILVGDGAKVKVTCRTEKGKKLEKTEGVIVGNRYLGTVLVPENVKPDDFLYLEVELPKHNLSLESNSIPVHPPIEVSSMQWSKTEVERDEEVGLSCVFENGVEEGDEVTVIIYEYDSDGNHDLVVKMPAVVKNGKVELQWRFIYQEDTDDILTDEEIRKYGGGYNPPEYFFVVLVDTIPVGKNQESGILTFKDFMQLEIDSGDIDLTGQKYVITYADGTTENGTFDKNTLLDLKKIPPGKCKIEFPDLP